MKAQWLFLSKIPPIVWFCLYFFFNFFVTVIWKPLFVSGSAGGIFWLFVFCDLTLLLLPICCLIIPIFLMLRWIMYGPFKWIDLGIGVALIVLCLMLLVVLGPQINRIVPLVQNYFVKEYLDSTPTLLNKFTGYYDSYGDRGRVYHRITYAPDYHFEEPYVVVFQCDFLGIWCRQLENLPIEALQTSP